MIHPAKDAATRREFLKRSLGLAAAVAVTDPSGLLAREELGGSVRPRACATPAVSRVVRVVSERVMPVRIVQPALLKDCLIQGLRMLTGEDNVADAWHRILKPDDIVLLKFNRSAARRLGTTSPMVTELLNSLVAAGWGLDRIIVLEAGSDVALVRKTRAADLRWQGKQVLFGKSGQDVFLAALDQATAIVNVPFLKTHHRATMTGCLKNLSHGLVRHPGQFHGGGCDPAIGEITASAEIRDKMRLHIVNAIRVVFDRGPEASEREVHTAGSLLVATDPVACDSVGYAVINEIRSLHGMNPLLPDAQPPRQLRTAARLGLGTLEAEQIDVQKVDL